MLKTIKDILEEYKIDSLNNWSLNDFSEFFDDYQLSERLIKILLKEYGSKIDIDYIVMCNKLSERFLEKLIKEYEEKINSWTWHHISVSQNLSKKFRNKYRNELYLRLYNKVHRTIPRKQKIKEMKEYAKKYNLEFDGEYLYAYRRHDKRGCGMYSDNTFYKNGVYYRDWRLDMRKDEEDSFGFGIFPKSNKVNKLVRVKVDDWGLCVNKDSGKCRVWGFEIVKDL